MPDVSLWKAMLDARSRWRRSAQPRQLLALGLSAFGFGRCSTISRMARLVSTAGMAGSLFMAHSF
jgi:hypothetical protein